MTDENTDPQTAGTESTVPDWLPVSYTHLTQPTKA